MKKLQLACGLFCVGAIAFTGCSLPVQYGGFASGGAKLTKALNPMRWGIDEDEPRSGTPQRIVATWSDTIRQTPGKPSERGFGGRLYFHDRANDPITVDGRLVVYAFNEQGRAPTDHKPTKRFVFPAEQLHRHMSVSEIGPSYSVWLPWGSVEGSPAEISLIARFEPLQGGGLVVSDQSKQRLPGQGTAVPDAETEMLANQPHTVQQAGYQDTPIAKPKTSTAEQPRSKMSTTTIRLPK